MKQLIYVAFLASIASCSSTGGSETGNPATLEDFSSSACKSRTPEPGREALVLESDAEGLQCVEWSRESSGALTVRLLNFPEPCADQYLGTSKLANDGALELSVYKDRCAVARCGTCVFDFEFQVGNVDASRPLDLRTGAAICATEPTSFDDDVILPIDQQDSGVKCHYLQRNAVEQYGSARASCGNRNMPCGDCGGLDTQRCAEGLTCSMVGENDSRCLEACASDDDCAGGLTTCRDGLCRSDLVF